MFTRNDSSDADSAQQRRLLVLAGIGGVALLVLALVLLLPKLFGGDSSSATAGPTFTHSPRATPTPSPTATDVAPPAVLTAAYEGSRDPFAKLPQELTASANSTGTGATTDAGTSTSTTTSSTGTTATTGAAGTAGTASGSSSGGTSGSSQGASSGNSSTDSSAGGLPVQVMSFSGSSAQIQIDSRPFTVQVGSQPVSGYTVTAIGGGKVTITHNGVSHTLAEGELQTF